MAGLSFPSGTSQLAAIVWLRSRLFVHAFRCKSGKIETAASLFLASFFALFALGPIFGAGAAAWFIVTRNRFDYVPLLLWVVFLVWTTFTISTKAASPTFDLATLLRFPLRFRNYLFVRLLFGLLDVPTVVCSLALFAAAIGAAIARPALLPVSFASFLLYDVAIILFFRMIFLWFDRWFAQRKTREILLGFFFVAMLAFQYVNLTLNGESKHHRQHHDPVAAARHEQQITRGRQAIQTAEPVLRLLPPGLAATAITRYGAAQPTATIAPLAGLTAYAAVFFTLFARRLRGEFHGENFNEVPARTKSVETPRHREAPARATSLIQACLTKEFLYLRRSGPLLFALITPIFMVFLLVTRAGLAQRPSEWILPGAIAYILLGLTAGMYNIFGTEGPGVQLYFLAPISLREIVLAKNLMSLALLSIEIAIASAIVLSSMPAPPLPTLCAVYVWAVFTVAISLTMGNIRSIYSPRLVDLGKFRQGRQSQINVLIALGVLVVCLAFGAAVLYLARHVAQPWLAAPVLVFFATAAIVFYRMTLNHLTRVALDRRETISAELCRT